MAAVLRCPLRAQQRVFDATFPLYLPHTFLEEPSGMRVLAAATEQREADGPAWKSEPISFVLIGPGMNWSFHTYDILDINSPAVGYRAELI